MTQLIENEFHIVITILLLPQLSKITFSMCMICENHNSKCQLIMSSFNRVWESSQ